MDVSIVSPSVSDGGNTRTPSENKRQGLAKRWCFTFNNYDNVTDVSNICETFETLGVSYVFGREVGELGTPHLQGYVEGSKKFRPIEYFKLNKKIHWISAKGTKNDNIKYCSKDGDYFTNFVIPKPIKCLKEEDLYDWQRFVFKSIKEEPDDRTINWVWEPNGCRGKTALCKLLCFKYNALICSGKSSDFKYLILKYKEKYGDFPTVILFDIPRSSNAFISYQGIEEVKNGLFCSSKYECEMIIMNSPHVFCFSNVEPDFSALSSDRWNVINISEL